MKWPKLCGGDSASHLTNFRCPRKKYQLRWLLVAHIALEIERGAEQREGAPRPKRCYLKIAVCLEAEGMGREGQRGETYEITLWKIELLKTYFHVPAIYRVYFPIDVQTEDF